MPAFVIEYQACWFVFAPAAIGLGLPETADRVV